MNRFRAPLAAAAGVIALTLTLTLADHTRVLAQGMKPLLVQIVNDASGPVPVADLRPAAERVQLQTEAGDGGVCSPPQRAVRRLMPDGTFVPAFTVPAGKILVLTDLRGEVNEETNVIDWTVGFVINLFVSVGPTVPHPRLTARAVVTADAAASGIVAVETHSLSGVYAGSGAPVCVGALQSFPHGGSRAEVETAEIEGYLIPE
jgi:hypothetical protein